MYRKHDELTFLKAPLLCDKLSNRRILKEDIARQPWKKMLGEAIFDRTRLPLAASTGMAFRSELNITYIVK
jgi:hypothetical protein